MFCEQLYVLEKLGEAHDDMERSYFQYLCQKKIRDRAFVIIAKNIISPFVWIIFSSLSFLVSLRKVRSDIKCKEVVIADKSLCDRLPSQFCGAEFIGFPFDFCLELKDLWYIKSIITRYPKSWYFILKVTVKIALYRSVINKYMPEVILCSCEYSFTSSILTYFCEMNNIQHINFMHGEKIFYIRDAYCRFSQFYVWDDYYIRLFRQLNANQSRFIVEIPSIFTYFAEKIDIKYDFKYYMGLETHKTLSALHFFIKKLLSSGYRIRIRPHPIYTSRKMLSLYFSEDLIEDPREIPIVKSIMETEYIIARGSTVLLQGHWLGKNIIIDDISDPQMYNYYFKSKSIIFRYQYVVLSDFLKNIM